LAPLVGCHDELGGGLWLVAKSHRDRHEDRYRGASFESTTAPPRVCIGKQTGWFKPPSLHNFQRLAIRVCANPTKHTTLRDSPGRINPNLDDGEVFAGERQN
jgi:hypothetical protein